MRRGVVLFAIATLLGVPIFAGCVAPAPTETVVEGTETHANEEVVLDTGVLSIPAGARYEVNGGALRLHHDPSVIVNGVIDVRGTLVVRDAAITNLLRLTVHPGATLTFERVRVTGGAVAPSLYLHSQDATVTASTLEVALIDVRGAADLRDNEIHARTALPAVYWRDSVVTFTGNTVDGPGFGLVFEGSTGEVSGNTVAAGTEGVSTAIAIRGGQLNVHGNTVTRGAVGIGAENAQVDIRDNSVSNTTQAGIAAVSSKATIAGNTVEGNRRAGIYLKDCTADTRVENNRIRSNGGGTSAAIRDSGAGVAVDGGAATIAGNDFSANDNGVAVLNGTATINQNNFDGHRLFAVIRDVGLAPGEAAAAQNQVDATNNWWGAASGPILSAPDTPASVPAAPGAERVGPGVNYAPWLAQRRAV